MSSNTDLCPANPNPVLCRIVLKTLLTLGKILTLFQVSKVKKESYDNELLDQVLKIVNKYETNVKGKTVEEILDILLNIREEARKNKDWNTADGIRNDLAKIGFEIQDTDSGPIWRKKLD